MTSKEQFNWLIPSPSLGKLHWVFLVFNLLFNCFISHSNLGQHDCFINNCINLFLTSQSVYLHDTQKLEAQNLSVCVFAMNKQPAAVLFFSPSCFYLIMSGLWYWLVLLLQSVNNDLAAAAAGCCCQAFDKHMSAPVTGFSSPTSQWKKWFDIKSFFHFTTGNITLSYTTVK